MDPVPYSPPPVSFTVQADGLLLDAGGGVWRVATAADQVLVEAGEVETQLIYDPEASLFMRIIRV